MQENHLNQICFGNVKNFFFVGGGQPLFEAVRFLSNKSQSVKVFTSQRHYTSGVNVDGQKFTLKEAISQLGVNCTLLTEFNPNSPHFNEFDSTSILITPSAEWIFSQATIDRFFGRVVNIHGTLLPEMKGGGGVSWNILMGNRVGGTTIHMVDSGIDTGDILTQFKYEFPPSVQSLEDYINYAEAHNSHCIKSFLEDVLRERTFVRHRQDSGTGSYWPRLNTEIHAYIDWNWSAEYIHRFVIAFGKPYGGAKTFLKSTQINLLETSIIKGGHDFHPFQYGLIYRVTHEAIFVATKGGTLLIHQATDIDNESIINKKILGYRLQTPDDKLSIAKSTRVIFNPNRSK